MNEALRQWKPEAGTPLSHTIGAAQRALEGAKGTRSIVLLTDGENRYGPRVDTVMRQIREANGMSGNANTYFHIVAFSEGSALERAFAPTRCDDNVELIAAKNPQQLKKAYREIGDALLAEINEGPLYDPAKK